MISEAFARSLADRYRVGREIGRGGMTTVYLADDVKHGRRVAIKVMHPEMVAAIGHDRFLREIEIAARLSHPHILPLFDSGAADGRLYYVMPFIEGESLRARLQRERQLPLDEALRLAREIASALGHAHRHGLVHRDIKPENVLLADGIALVADFGIARAASRTIGESRTTVGTAIGTPAYMAPEQALGSSDVDGRADLYALGCVLYEMLAGQPPFSGPVASLAYQHMSADPRPVSDLRPGIPPAIVSAIGRALAKTPADRPASAARFAESLALNTATAVTPAPPGREAVVPNNLPKQRSHFIGRERELAECARLMGDTRLLTITGIGGCGKTRLALRLAENLLESFPDGAWFVDLAPLKDADRVALAAATALGVREESGTPLVQRITAHLAGRRALLLLDNCEHVLGAASELADAVLVACGDVKIVATSREGLGIEGERPVSLRSLSVPPASTTERGAIAAADSVRLFVDRAQTVDARFEIDERTGPVVAEICRRLDGIPLAIELAAARVNVLSAGEILAKLDDRFRLLTGGSKTALPRHQTLRATITWSDDLLPPAPRRLFRLLSVFSGGWTLDAATRVVGDDADEFEVLEAITRLVEKSLVLAERTAGGTMRYSMLETVRQYAQERLNESGEGDGARTRHLEYFVALAEQSATQLTGPEQGAWIARMDLERENLLSAHAWCDREGGDAQRGLRLVFAMRLWATRTGVLSLAYRVTLEALQRKGAEARTLARCGAAFAAGTLCAITGHSQEARRHGEESLSIAREVGDPLRTAAALQLLGAIVQADGDFAGARALIAESLALARDLHDRYLLSGALNGLAELHRAGGDLDAAEPLYAEVLALSREMGDRTNISINLSNLAMVSIGRGGGDRARAMLCEALAIGEEIGSKMSGHYVIHVSTGLAAFLAEWERAARFHGVSGAQQEQLGLQHDAADDAFVLPLVDRARSALGAGEFAVAEAAGRALSYEESMTEAREWLRASPPS